MTHYGGAAIEEIFLPWWNRARKNLSPVSPIFPCSTYRLRILYWLILASKSVLNNKIVSYNHLTFIYTYEIGNIASMCLQNIGKHGVNSTIVYCMPKQEKLQSRKDFYIEGRGFFDPIQDPLRAFSQVLFALNLENSLKSFGLRMGRSCWMVTKENMILSLPNNTY